MAPALVMFLWSLQDLPRLRLVRQPRVRDLLRACGWHASTARIDVEEQPHKSVGFLTGVPAPVGAGLAFLADVPVGSRPDGCFASRLLVAAWLVGDRAADDFEPRHAELDLDPAARTSGSTTHSRWWYFAAC
jgi:CDP-diacylglycerol--serine O-phosphatidyltransferase